MHALNRDTGRRKGVVRHSLLPVVGVGIAMLLASAPVWGTEPLPTNPGSPIDLTATPVSGTLSQPGWAVKSYPMNWPDQVLTSIQGAIATFEGLGGLCAGNVTGEPELTYLGGMGGDLPFPGFLRRQGEAYYGFLAKGWINFPEAGHYSLGIIADDYGEVAIGGTVLFGSHYTQLGTGDVNGGVYIDLNVLQAGIYPIQFVWYQGYGDQFLSFYRRVGGAAGDRKLPLGSLNPENLADHPMVYGLLDGNPAPDLSSTYTPTPSFANVDLDPAQKVGDVNAGTGEQAFTTKMITCPWIYYAPAAGGGGYNIFHSRDSGEERWSTIPFRWLDFLGDANQGTVQTATINYYNPGGGAAEGYIPNGQQFPLPIPLPPTAYSHFAMRAEGFITFPTAKTYYLGISADYFSHLHIGQQMVASFQVQWWTTVVMALNVQEAGTYPIRLEYADGDPGGHLEFVELTPSGVVLVNGPGSDITVHTTCSSGPYRGYIPHGVAIPADRKVAEVGDGGISGWDVTLAKSINETLLPTTGIGVGTMLTNNDFLGAPCAASIGTDTPDFIDYVDPGDPDVRFGGQLNWSRFPNALTTGNDLLGVTATGYIEFPQAGDYGIETSTDGTCVTWIGGKIVQSWPGYAEQPAIWAYAQDSVVTSVHIDEPGIYDIRVDYTEFTGGSLFSVWQQLPDGSAALINSPQATVHVYRTLNAGNPNSRYRHPMHLPLSSKVAELDKGKTPGLRMQMVRFYPDTPDGPNYHGGAGHDSFWSLEAAEELLKSVLDRDPIAMMNQQGYLFGDAVVPYAHVGDGALIPAFPGVAETGIRDWIAGRFTGYIGLSQGGHLFAFISDDGWNCDIGGQNISRWGGIHGAGYFLFYVYAPADGLYPITVDYYNGYGGQAWVLAELNSTATGWYTLGYDNTWTTIYSEIDVCSTPFADVDGDHDVDLADFGLFQACFTGPGMTAGSGCTCLDRAGADGPDGAIDALDLNAFINCWTGPGVQWVSSVDCPGT